MTESAPTAPPIAIPAGWRSDLDGYGWAAQTIGRSGAAVFRLEASGRPTLFVKTGAAGSGSELPDEAARLRWLAASGTACPSVLAEARAAGQDWLLTTALRGRDLASACDLAPGQIVRIAADALHDLHRLDVTSCPFDRTLARCVARARARLEAGLVDDGDFDEERHGRSAADLFREVLARCPDRQDLVVAHGDACLPNLLADQGRFAGFVDCARLGIADRHQDLALATWSIRHNLGAPWVEPFLQRYGVAADPERLGFYRLLDEFF